MKAELGSVRKKEPETATEHIHRFVIEHKMASGFTIGLILVAIFLRIIPIDMLLSVLPSWASKLTIMALLAQIIAFLPARWLHYRFRDSPIDIIVEGDPARNEITQLYQYYEGLFEEEFEFKHGQPIKWTNKHGINVYQVVEIDEENKVARCSWLGDLNNWELLKARQNFEQQKMWNDNLRKLGSELYLKWDEITSKVEYEVTNRWVRMLNSVKHPNELNEVLDGATPDELSQESDEISLGGVLEDLDIDEVKTLQDIKNGNGGQNVE